MATIKQIERDQALEHLRSTLKPGDTVYTDVKQVARSGMSRHIAVYAAATDEQGRAYIADITYHVGKAIGERLSDKTGGLVISGCGMDMGFHTVYQLGSRLWPQGTPEPHGTRNGEPDSAGGYALKQRWL